MPRQLPLQHTFRYMQPVYQSQSSGSSNRAGVTVTAHATPHTKGAWVELIASTASLATLAAVKCTHSALSTNTATLLDIGIGAAASETVIIADLTFGGGGFFTDWAGEAIIPITIPAGSRVSARVQSVVVSAGTSVFVDLFHPRTPLGQDAGPVYYPPTAVTYGANTGTSQGTALTAPGSLNTKSAWTEITASTTRPVTDLCATFGRGGLGNASSNTMLVDVGYGPSGAETVIVENSYLYTNNNEALFTQSTYCGGLDLPVGTRLVARYQRVNANNGLDCCITTNYGKAAS